MTENTLPKLRRVLIVDDDSDTASLIVEILREKFGPDVKFVFASDGINAWRTAMMNPVDAVVSDWDMPELDGMNLLHLLRTHENTKDLPFLMITARNEPERVKQAIDAGVDEYLLKPFKPAELVSKFVKLAKGRPKN